MVKRIGLDFIISRLPLVSPILGKKEKIGLIKAILLLLKKSDYSVTRRLFSWLFSDNHEGEIDIEDENVAEVLVMIVEAVKEMFAFENASAEEVVVYIKCVDELLKHQVKLVDYILDRVSIDMIVRVIKKSGGEDSDVVVKCKRFFTGYDSSYIDCLWNSILLLFDEDEGSLKNEDFLEILSFCLDHISFMNEDAGPSAILPITANLIGVINRVDVCVSEAKEVNKYLSLAKRFTDKIWEYIRAAEGHYEELYADVSQEKRSAYRAIITEFHSIYPKIIEKVSNTKQIQKDDFIMFDCSTDLVIKTHALLMGDE